MKEDRMPSYKVLFYVSVSGDKFPAYHPLHNLHEREVKRYCNIGNDSLESDGCYDLPKDGYPYSTEMILN